MGELRIEIRDLQPRDAESEELLQEALQGLRAALGASCERNCDCGVGLVCRDKTCTADW